MPHCSDIEHHLDLHPKPQVDPDVYDGDIPEGEEASLTALRAFRMAENAGSQPSRTRCNHHLLNQPCP